MRAKRRPKVEVDCLTCGKLFLVWPSRLDIGKGKFCSTSCGKMGTNNHRWIDGKNHRNGYILLYMPKHPASVKGYVPEHRIVMERHLNRRLTNKDNNGLNNQKSNLRIATHWQNLANRPLQRNNTSGYRGVSWSKQNKKWFAQIYVNSKTINLGFYDDVIEAVKAYNKAAVERYGEFARLNEV